MRIVGVLTLVLIACYSRAEDASTETALDTQTTAREIIPSEVIVASTTTAVPVVIASSTTPQITPTTQTPATTPSIVSTTATAKLEPTTTINYRTVTRSELSSTTEIPVVVTSTTTPRITTSKLPIIRTTQKNDRTTTVAPRVVPRPRQRSRKLQDDITLDGEHPDLLPIKVIKSDEPQTRRWSGRPVKPSEIKAKVLPTEKPKSRSWLLSTATTSKPIETEKSDEKDVTFVRRGKVRYTAGRNLKDDQAINFESKYAKNDYKFSYETKDGQTRAENGVFENMGTEDQKYVVKGSYSYLDSEGIQYVVTYTADSNGFHPVISVNNPNRL